MARTDQAEEKYYYDDYDRPLVSKIRRTQVAEWLLLGADLLAALFWESDVLDLGRISMPTWWLVPIPILHILLTLCISVYLSGILKYLCLYKPSRAVRGMNGGIREKRCNRLGNLMALCGAFTGGVAVVMAMLPHFLTGRRPDYYFFGFVLPKTILFVIVIQIIILLRINLEVKAAIAEWRILRRTRSNLTFSTYACYYDGDEWSITPQ